jgi:hypothetical protein
MFSLLLSSHLAKDPLAYSSDSEVTMMSRIALLPLFFAALLFTTEGQLPSPSPSPSESSKGSSESTKEGSTQDGSQQKPEAGLRLLDPPLVIIDGSSGGTTQLELTATADGTYSVRCQNFKSNVTQRFLNAVVNLSEPPATATGATAKKKLTKNERWVLKVDVSNFLEAGEAKANLVDETGRTIGELTAVRLQFPFAVKLDTANPEKPELSLTRKQDETITLRNDDAYSYPVLYNFSIDGLPTAEGKIELPPNGTKSFTLKPPDAWFSGPLRGIFKSAEGSGRLTLSYDPATVSQKTFLPTKSIPVTFHLNYWQAWAPEIIGTLILLAVLTLGGLTSLLVSCGIPNKLRQVVMREQVFSLEKRISAISPSVDSRLRVLLRMERKKLEDLLRTKRIWSTQILRDPLLLVPEWTLPDFADTLADAALDIAKLKTRVDLAEQVDSLRHSLESASDKLPPTIVEQVNSNLQETADSARKSQLIAEEISLAKSLLTKAEALMKGWKQDTSCATTISSRLKRVRVLLGVGTTDANRLEDTEVCKRFKTSMPTTFKLLDDPNLMDPANIVSDDYKYLDTATAKLALAFEYIRFFQSLPASRQVELDQREKLLLDALAKDSWQSLRFAQTYVREVTSGVYPEHLRTELLAVNGNNGDGQVSIELDRQQVKQAEPLELYVQFRNPSLRRVPALDEWTPLWTIKNRAPDSPELREKWWSVWHYFDKAGEHEIKVYFEDFDGKPINDNAGAKLCVSKTIEVLPNRQSDTRERLRAEILKLGIALFVALVALLGGAQEQLAKLNVLQGLLAVFVMGFSANVVKDLITQKSVKEPS